MILITFALMPVFKGLYVFILDIHFFSYSYLLNVTIQLLFEKSNLKLFKGTPGKTTQIVRNTSKLLFKITCWRRIFFCLFKDFMWITMFWVFLVDRNQITFLVSTFYFHLLLLKMYWLFYVRIYNVPFTCAIFL